MVELNVKNNVAFVSFDGEFTIHELKDVRELIRQIEEKNMANIVFDMSRIKYIDSSAIGLLVTVLKYARKNGGSLKLYRPSEEIKRILKLVNLSTFFETIDTFE